MKLISLLDAKSTNLKHYFTGKPCKRGHIAKRFVSSGNCCKCHLITSQKHKVSRRQAALISLGSVCSSCSFSNPLALQIDHVNGGGGKEYKQLGQHGIHKAVINTKLGTYQLLCANCNWIKRYENRECNQATDNPSSTVKDRQHFRQKLLTKFGNTCRICKIKDPRCLQLDHVSGGGSRQRKKSNWYSIYKSALSSTDGQFQLLCANCNWIKRHTNNELGS